MKRFLSYTTMLVLAVALIASAIPTDAFARGSRSSSSRSSSGRSSSWGKSSKPASKPASKSSTWGKKSTTSNASRSKTAAKPMSAADKAAHTKAKAAGTSFKSQADASKSFKSNPAMQKKYTSKYTSQPATRPSHIPASTKGANGSTVNINYNSQYGGYGHMGVGGVWSPYSALADVAVMSMLMRNHNYMVQPAVHAPVIVQNTAGAMIVKILFGGIFLGALVFFIIKFSN